MELDELYLKIVVKNAINEALSSTTEIKADSKDCGQILRMAISSEISAITLYTSLAEMADNPLVKKVLLDVIKEEKTHVAEFESILNDLDPEQKQENINGSKEVEDIKDDL
ncbi:MAG: ferritin family protein [Candidatus Omnitrophota bacterium]